MLPNLFRKCGVIAVDETKIVRCYLMCDQTIYAVCRWSIATLSSRRDDDRGTCATTRTQFGLVAFFSFFFFVVVNRLSQPVNSFEDGTMIWELGKQNDVGSLFPFRWNHSHQMASPKHRMGETICISLNVCLQRNDTCSENKKVNIALSAFFFCFYLKNKRTACLRCFQLI